jgi:peptidoglycan L-alanyl-D-glutamate endopeptidase CwlK
MPSFSETSKQRLATCDSRLQLICNEAIEIVDFVVLEGHRGKEAQNKAFETGASKKRWPDGNHNALPSRAIDIAPFLPEVKIDWKDLVAFGRLMGIVHASAHKHGIKLRFGLDWDGDFRTTAINDPNEHFLDAPHVELVTP